MSSLASLGGNVGAGQVNMAKPSRVEQDTTRIISVAKSIRNANSTITRHLVYLGYWSLSPAQAPGTLEAGPKGVGNLAEAIRDLDSAINELNDTLASFE